MFNVPRCIHCGKRSIKPLCRKCVERASTLLRNNNNGYHVRCSVCGKKTKTKRKELVNDEFKCPDCR